MHDNPKKEANGWLILAKDYWIEASKKGIIDISEEDIIKAEESIKDEFSTAYLGVFDLGVYGVKECYVNKHLKINSN